MSFSTLNFFQMKARQRPYLTMRKFKRATAVLVCIWVTLAVRFLSTNIPQIVTSGKRSADRKKAGGFHGFNPSGNKTDVFHTLLFQRTRPPFSVVVGSRAGHTALQNSTRSHIKQTKPVKQTFVIKEITNLTADNKGDNVRVVKKKLVISEGTAFRPPDTDVSKLKLEKINVVHMKKEAAEKRYYTIKTIKVNPIDHELVITGGQICDAASPYLLIMVPSVPSHFAVRDVIRNTYGSFARNSGTVHIKTNSTLNETVKIMFLVGKDGNINTDNLLKNESRIHGDIVQADFRDSYFNLTRKMLVALKWAAMYCNEIDFFLKADEDVFVNVPTLVSRLKRDHHGIQGAIYGHINKRSSVKRTGKWAVGWREFPLLFYPTYASGNSYVISGNIIPRMFMVSEYFPYMPIEDAFITGILARVVEARHVDVRGFTYWEDGVPNPCSFVRDSRISATKVDEALMKKLWQALQDFDKNCRYNINAF